MDPEEKNGGSVDSDLRLARGVSKGDPDAWREFVDRFTGWAIYRSRKWCEAQCRHSFAEVECGLYAVSRRMRGLSSSPLKEECDEGMDTYIWIMEQLRKKAGGYKGKNNSRLSTFVFRVLNSKELYIDWLRWKYGRVI